MSHNSTDDSLKLPAKSKGAKPAKAAKKAAAKKTPAKKAAVKKTPAKKAAKKSATKVAKKTATKTAAKKAAAPVSEIKAPSAPAPAPTVSAPIQARPIEPIAAPRPIAPPVLPPPPSQYQPSTNHSETNDAPRIGRVPGGGPIQHHPQHTHREPNPDGSPQAPRESRSKKRRDKRKRRREPFGDSGNRNENRSENRNGHDNQNRNERNDRNERPPQEDRSATVLSGPPIDTNGIIEMTPKGYAFLRLASTNYDQAKDDVYISADLIRTHSLRHGQWIHGMYQESNRGPQLVEITTVNDMTPVAAAKLPHFDELTAINPNKRIAFETTSDRYTTRVVDIVAPVGRGQRGLIVSPPRSGKTTLLLHMAEAIREKYDEQIHLMILLVDERPEEVTEFRRALPGAEIYASSNDEASRNHTRIAELAIERAKRLVEAGKDVFLLMDSITRLARAYNGAMSSGGGKNRNRATGSGGITIGALEVPRRLFAAARNTREAGSLTILATALIQTNSRADEAIFMEFKGTGNMELVLDRKIAESYVYPAVDIFKSGTRREELLLAEHMLHKIHLIRRGLSGHRPYEAMERLLYFVKKFPNNPQMLLEIKG